ncbi:MAG: CarD family transcriptional regulator [Deltaproteobacteria bacterium]|nr:CarD family transcriptional regulator [Deltaproteobacteria bacterium]
MFKIGDKAVYPAHGVGVIEDIKCKVISGNKRTFYVMRILDKDMTIMIPTENAQTVGLRGIIDKKEIPKVFKVLAEKNVEVDCQTWNRRYREYMEKIKSGSVFEVAEVLRDLVHLKSDKDLSFGERQMLDLAQNLLVKELSIAKNVAEDKMRLRLQSIFTT